MKKLREALRSVEDKLGMNERLLAKARRRAKTFRERAEHNHAEQLKAQKQAHKFLTFGPNENQAKGERLLRKANRCKHRAERSHDKAIYWKRKIKQQIARVHHIDTSLAAIQKEMRELGPVVDFDKQVTTGGSFRERWIASNVASWQRYVEGIRAGRYSQEGVANMHLPYGPGPWEGRDDCSSYGRSQCLATGADDPSGHDFSPEGFTGDMAEAHGRWKQVSKAQMMAAGQGYIIYGSGVGHHTEMFAPTKSEPERTIGHGDEAVNPGTIHLFGMGEVERYYAFN